MSCWPKSVVINIAFMLLLASGQPGNKNAVSVTLYLRSLLLLHKYFCFFPTFMLISLGYILLERKWWLSDVRFLGVLLHYDKVYVLFVSDQRVNTRPSLWVLLALRKLFYIMDQLGLSDFPSVVIK